MVQGMMGIIISRLTSMIHGWGRTARDTFALLPRTRINYEKEVGDPTKSDVVMGCILWAMRTFPEAPLSMRTYNADGEEEQVHTHRLLSLIRRPNPAYPSGTLWASTVLSYLADGNAYWLKVRGNANQPIQLWWAPHEFIEPYTTEYAEGTEFISYYRYIAPGLGEFYIQPEDVVHFRLGQDPMDPRKGLSPTKSVMREIFSDAEAANWTAALLRNGAVPGVIVAPDLEGTGGRTPPPKDVEDMKARIKENFTGDSRGEPIVLGRGVQLTQFGYSPAEMDLKELRRLPEERVSSQLGIPAIVAGLGAGLERSTFSNFAEARESAFENGIIPMQSVMAETLMHQLLEPHYMRGMNGNSTPELYFDLSRVRVLQEDRVAQAERLSTLFQGGVITRAEARQELGHEVHEYDKVYMVSSAFVERPVDMPPDALQPPQAMVLPPGVDQPQLMPPNGLEGDTGVIEGQVVNGDAASDTECPTCGEVHWPHCEDCDDEDVVAEEPTDDSDMPDDDEGDAGDSDGDGDTPDDDSDEGSESDEDDEDDEEDDDEEEEPPPPRRRRQARPRRRIRTKQSPFERPGGKPGAAGGLWFKAQKTPQQQRLNDRLLARQPELAQALEDTLYEGFQDLGKFVADNLSEHEHLFDDLLAQIAAGDLDALPDLTLADISGVMEAIDGMNLERWKEEVFSNILENFTEEVTADTIRVLQEELELPFDIPDEVARDLIQQGGKRMGLIDISKNTKSAVFNALRDGRAAGEGVEQLRRRIEEYVPAGRFVNAGPRYRARMIARTEAKWAQNKSSLAIYRESEFVTGCLAHDAQLGPDRSDPECIDRDGKTFTPEQAEKELASEHPNFTLVFTPVIGEPIEPDNPAEKVRDDPYLGGGGDQDVRGEPLFFDADGVLDLTEMSHSTDYINNHIEFPEFRERLLLKEGTQQYLSPEYREINGALRGKNELNEFNERRVNDILSDMQAISTDTRVFRGDARTVNLDIGDEVTDTGFISTSTSPHHSLVEFGVRKGDEVTGYEIVLTKGQPAIVTNESESEIILPPGTKFKVVDVKKDVVMRHRGGAGGMLARRKMKESRVSRLYRLEVVDE